MIRHFSRPADDDRRVVLEVVLPNESAEMEPGSLTELAVLAEELGYAAAWLPDHLLPPGEYGPTYGGVYEPLVTIAHLAARTRTLRLGTSVLVLPMRDPFLLAKQVATLERLTGGRVTLGVGLGWDRAEFANVGANFADRGVRTDEAIELMRALYAGERSFPGEHYGFDGGFFEPRPDHAIPIMVGGTSERALRRAAAYADEWQGFDLTPSEFADRVDRLRALTDRPIRVGTRIAWSGGEAELDATVADARALASAGADTVAVWFGPHAGVADRMRHFAERWGPADGSPSK